MFKKFKIHCRKPITYGAYYKICAVALFATLVITVGSVLKMKHYTDELYIFEEDDSEEES